MSGCRVLQGGMAPAAHARVGTCMSVAPAREKHTSTSRRPVGNVVPLLRVGSRLLVHSPGRARRHAAAKALESEDNKDEMPQVPRESGEDILESAWFGYAWRFGFAALVALVAVLMVSLSLPVIQTTFSRSTISGL